MITIYDVAKSADVSPKTVSRVLNGAASVRPETRSAVHDAMAELGYVPSSAARGLRSNRSGLIGLTTQAISGSEERPDLFAGLPDLVIVQAIQARLGALDRTLLVSDTGSDPTRVEALMRTFTEHRVEGLLHVAPFHQEVRLPTNAGVGRIVIVNGYDAMGTPAVVPDDYRGQHALVERMAAVGHRRIAYLTLPATYVATTQRTAAYRDALKAAGIGFDPDLVLPGALVGSTPEDETRLQGEAVERYLSLPEPPTAICAGNDRMALRLYGLLRSRGLRVPEDISVAGYDDHRIISETLFPALTTVELPYRAMGEVAVDTLARLIDGAPPAGTTPVRVAGDLRWRASVAPRYVN